MVQIWQEKTRQGTSELPPIIPMVIYHGQSRWRVAEDFAGLFNGPESLRPYWPTFRYQLYDLGRLSREEIRGLALNQFVYLTMKHIKDPDFPKLLPSIFRQYIELANAETAVKYLEVVLRYISAAADSVTEEDIRIALDTVLSEQEDKIMPTLAEKWVEQGKQQQLVNNILDILLLRFDIAPPVISERLEEINDVDTLQQLLRQAVTAESLVSFEQFLNSL